MTPEAVARLKTEIQSLGVRLDEAEPTGRLGGAGPAEGRVILLSGRPASVPVASPFVADSPYRLSRHGEAWFLMTGDDRWIEVDLPPEPAFHGKTTRTGLPFGKVALLHGADCLATTVIQACGFRRGGGGCRFCGIDLSLDAGRTTAKKDPADLAEVAAEAARAGLVSHVVLTSGSTPGGEGETALLAACTRAVKAASSLPVHVQLLPPDDPRALGRLEAAGADTVGIHMESFDEEVLRRTAPHKAALGPDRFDRAWLEAVERFGPNQVSSFLIAGLGESDASVLEGGERLARIGVYPYLVPLRPIPGTPMGDGRPPAPERMERLYRGLASAVLAAGLEARRSMAGCVRCGACSALPEYEPIRPRGVRTRIAAGDADLERCFEIRRRVFVEELAFFPGTDRDDHEARAVHLLGECDGEAVGTFRQRSPEWWSTATSTGSTRATGRRHRCWALASARCSNLWPRE